MRKRLKISRYHTSLDVNFHGRDRATIKKFDLEDLPTRESMRMAIWRGPNCWGDNTSFGDYNSGEPKHRIFEKVLQKYVGKSFDEYYSEMCSRYKGRDRYIFDGFIHYSFENRFRFGYDMTSHMVVDGIIVKR